MHKKDSKDGMQKEHRDGEVYEKNRGVSLYKNLYRFFNCKRRELQPYLLLCWGLHSRASISSAFSPLSQNKRRAAVNSVYWI